uniref:INO80 complex subunit E n=1 Tax=Hucho hucho TaxID=62062 RepID=A0A4W5LPD5_9TELE
MEEQECFQEELRRSQRKLLKVSRDKSFLLDRLLQYVRVDGDSSDSDATASSENSEGEGTRERERDRRKKRSRPSFIVILPSLSPLSFWSEPSPVVWQYPLPQHSGGPSSSQLPSEPDCPSHIQRLETTTGGKEKRLTLSSISPMSEVCVCVKDCLKECKTIIQPLPLSNA